MTDTSKTASMRERLATLIAKNDMERGRPLTAREKLDNLAEFMAEDHGPCPFCGVADHEPCGYVSNGEMCKL